LSVMSYENETVGLESFALCSFSAKISFSIALAHAG
jgi:hypothetical protein